MTNIGKKVEEITLDDAIGMFQYPKEIGAHPESGATVSVNIGPFGYYVACDGVNASIGKSVLKRVESVDNVNLEEALELLRKKAERPPRTRGRYAKKTAKAKKTTKATKSKKKKDDDVEDGEESSSAKTEKKKKTKKTKVEIPGVKKPLTAFFAFSADERANVKAAHPEYKIGDVAKALGEMWSNLDADRKAKYESDAKEAKEAYEKAKSEYESVTSND